MDIYRKVYAQKTYHFIKPAKCCPYLSDRHCDLRKFNVCDSDENYNKKICSTSRYYDKCTNFVAEVSTIKPNRYFKTSYHCPYLIGDTCELRKIRVSEKNRTLYHYTCKTTDYAKKCPYYIGKISKIKCKPPKKTGDCCPHKEDDWCKHRKVKVGSHCKKFYDHTCCKSNYTKCCPHYMESNCDDD